MGTGSTAQPVDAMRAGSDCLKTSSMTREVLQHYPWPLPTRVAGYVTIAAALLGLLAHESVYHHGAMIPTVALMGAILVGYQLVSGGRPQLSRRQGLALVAMQTICAIVVGFMVNGNGPAFIPLYILAAEIQFLAPFRAALAGTLGLWLLSVGTLEFVAVRLSEPVTLQAVLSDGAAQLCGFVFVAALTRSAVTEVIQRHQATILVDELTAAHAQLQTYADGVEALTVARERNRLARDIHDTLGHYLTVINVQLETAQKLSMRDAARSQAALATAKSLASECLAEVRRSVAALRPAALDGVALPEAIGRLIDDLRRASGLTIHVEGQGVGTLSPAVEVVVYRVIQEALTNVRKHAQAQNVWLRTEWGRDWFTTSVRDDGRGASPDTQHSDASPATGLGLGGMRERVAAVGGTLEVTSAPGAGFCVLLRVPCSPGTPGTAAEQQRAQEVRAQ